MPSSNSTLCPSENVRDIDQSSFWSSSGVNWDAHRIGWVIAGVCTIITLSLTVINCCLHAINYTRFAEQRQILRILYMPAVYATISFFSYRFFRSYTYYDFVEAAYESITLSSFLLLLFKIVDASAAGGNGQNAMLHKAKTALPLPLCCWRYQPTKPRFLHVVKLSALQYVIVRPALSIAGIITQRYGVLCQSGPWSFKTAHTYITVIDSISISITLYALVLFYGLTKGSELQGHRPLAKFLAIKLIVMFTFYQSLLFDVLEGRVIKATQYWTETNIADGLNALAICIEMVFFSMFMFYAYPWRDYRSLQEQEQEDCLISWWNIPKAIHYTIPKANWNTIWKAIWDSINILDLFIGFWTSLHFLCCMRDKRADDKPNESFALQTGGIHVAGGQGHRESINRLSSSLIHLIFKERFNF